MPPKKDKKGGGKGKKKKAASKDAGEVVSPEDQIKLLQSQTTSLEFRLACKTEETSDLIGECSDLRTALAESNKKYQEQKQLTADISATMTREFKLMQDQLIEKIADRERIIADLRDELLENQKVATEKLAEKDRIIQQKDEDAAICRQEMEDLCKHFAGLFEEATKKVSSIM